jgi:uncharacterized protein (TIGR02145 family)
MKIINVIILLIIGNALYAQNYYIPFSASGESSIIDSVYVENLTQGTRLTLPGSDTLHLVYSLYVDDLKSNNASLLLFPNPGEGLFYTEFFNHDKSDVQLVINDISGKVIFTETKELLHGTYVYEISGIPAGAYILSIKTNSKNYQSKILSMKENSESILVVQRSYYQTGSVNTNTKSTKQIYKMQYNDGERLLFKGYSQGRYARVLTLIPDASQNVDFLFIPCTDADSNHYTVVTIGGQTWMAENLRTTKCSNGQPLSNGAINWPTTIPSYCWYHNDSVLYSQSRGALYNWYVIDTCNVCPVGWHVPSLVEIFVLLDYCGGYEIAGGKLKLTGTELWLSPNIGATNEFGFCAIPCGLRSWDSNSYGSIYGQFYAWSSTQNYNDLAQGINISSIGESVSYGSSRKKCGYSIRCLKD